jgi:hypothetical protein
VWERIKIPEPTTPHDELEDRCLSRLGAASRPCGCHRHREGIGLPMTSRYAGREAMEAKAACVRAVQLPEVPAVTLWAQSIICGGRQSSATH